MGNFVGAGRLSGRKRSRCANTGCDGTLTIQFSQARIKNGPQTQANNRTQQPAQVVARGAQHGMRRIAGLPFEPAATHTVVVLHMADDRFNRLASLGPTSLCAGQCLVFAAMNQVYRR